MPLAVGAVALTTGLGVTVMVKAFGVGFLARARSDQAAEAREASAEHAGRDGSWPPRLHRAGGRAAGRGRRCGGCWTSCPGTRSAAPISGAACGCPAWQVRSRRADAVALIVAVTRRGRTDPVGCAPASGTVTIPLWACGADVLSARMQYTATSFAEPLQRVFDDVLRPDTDIEISHAVESRYLVEKVTFRAQMTDTIEQRLYRRCWPRSGLGRLGAPRPLRQRARLPRLRRARPAHRAGGGPVSGASR